MRRRAVLHDGAAMGVGAAIVPVLATLTAAWRESDPPLKGASVSQEMIDDWEDAASTHIELARIDPPAVVLAALAADFSDMAPHLARKQPDSVGTDLAHAAAPYATLIAGKCIDLGARREAHRWWRKSRALAERSGDPLLAAWLRSREALYRRGDHGENLREVLAVAQEARRLAGGRPSGPLVGALSAEAQILARLGRYDDAVAVLRRAEGAYERLPAAVGVEGRAWREREGGLLYDESLIYTLAGDVRRASQAQDASKGVGGATATEIELHRAAVTARSDPEQGMVHAARIIDALPPERRSMRHLTAAQLVLHVVPDRAMALPAERELQALTAA